MSKTRRAPKGERSGLAATGLGTCSELFSPSSLGFRPVPARHHEQILQTTRAFIIARTSLVWHSWLTMKRRANAARRLLDSSLSKLRHRPISSDTMLAHVLNERRQVTAVKPIMDRARITLVALLPALWLLIPGQYLLGACAVCTNTASCDTTCAFEGAKQCPLHSVCSFDAAARPVKSRIAPQVPKGNFIPLEPVSRSHAVERTPTAVSAQRESPLALATSWQFTCRAALHPRAPSSVS